MATPRLGLVVEDEPTELSCSGNVSGQKIWQFEAKVHHFNQLQSLV